ncbi:MAG: endonuclease domain-containing protein [Bosea sp. (in: a-proteobacteria)]
MWSKLRNRQLAGYKFVRQEPIGPYFADFCCREKCLIVEIDGGQHSHSAHDERRDNFLQCAGYRVLRFWNFQVFSEMESVLDTIWNALEDAPHPSPLPAGGERE